MFSVMPRRWAPVVVLSVIALFTIAGCSGGSSGTSGGLDQFRAQALQVLQNQPPAGSEATGVVDQKTVKGINDEILSDDAVASRGTAAGNFTGMFTANGLTFNGNWTVSQDPFQFTGDCTANGTLAGTGTAGDGTVVHLHRTSSVVTGVIILTLTGTLQPPGQGVLTISKGEQDITMAADKSSASVVSHIAISYGGNALYAKDMTRNIDLVATGHPRTLSGTIGVGSMTDSAAWNQAIFSKLRYTIDASDPANPHGHFQSGSVILANQSGYMVNLLAKADFSLSGNITDRDGNVAGTMTVKDGQVTITKK